LDESIKSALEQDYANIEVLVVDNRSTDETVNHLKEKFGERIKIIELNKNYGYCLGNNLALKYVDKDSKYCLFLNPDAIIAKDYVKKLVMIAEKDPRIVALQGLEIQPQKQYKRLGGFLNIASYYSLDLAPSKNNKDLSCLETFFVFSTAMLVRRKVIGIVGGFPADFFLYFDEADLGFRLRALGFKTVSCGITSYIHHVSGTVSKIKGLNIIAYYFAVRNRLRIMLRYFHSRYLLFALLINTVITVYHIFKKPRIIRRVLIRALFRILSPNNLRKDLMIRRVYIKGIKKNKILERFIICRI
jgi:GT2 family glycosyltransferase